jgi:hypothetical protein
LISLTLAKLAADYCHLLHGAPARSRCDVYHLLISLQLQVIVNTSKAVTLILGVYLLNEVANASASAGMCLSVVGALLYALLP